LDNKVFDIIDARCNHGVQRFSVIYVQYVLTKYTFRI